MGTKRRLPKAIAFGHKLTAYKNVIQTLILTTLAGRHHRPQGPYGWGIDGLLANTTAHYGDTEDLESAIVACEKALEDIFEQQRLGQKWAYGRQQVECGPTISMTETQVIDITDQQAIEQIIDADVKSPFTMGILRLSDPRDNITQLDIGPVIFCFNPDGSLVEIKGLE